MILLIGTKGIPHAHQFTIVRAEDMGGLVGTDDMPHWTKYLQGCRHVLMNTGHDVYRWLGEPGGMLPRKFET